VLDVEFHANFGSDILARSQIVRQYSNFWFFWSSISSS